MSLDRSRRNALVLSFAAVLAACGGTDDAPAPPPPPPAAVAPAITGAPASLTVGEGADAQLRSAPAAPTRSPTNGRWTTAARSAALTPAR